MLFKAFFSSACKSQILDLFFFSAVYLDFGACLLLDKKRSHVSPADGWRFLSPFVLFPPPITIHLHKPLGGPVVQPWYHSSHLTRVMQHFVAKILWKLEVSENARFPCRSAFCSFLSHSRFLFFPQSCAGF